MDTPTPATQTKPWYAKDYAPRPDQSTIVIDAEKHVINRQGKDFVLYAGLLDAAHKAGLTAIRTIVVQVPGPTNGGMAVVQATVEFPWGEFSGIGDADDGNVTRNIAPHKMRMAETRAKARALRDALSIGMVALEEMGPEPGEQPAGPARPAQPARDEQRSSYGAGVGSTFGHQGAQPRKSYGTVLTRPPVEG